MVTSYRLSRQEHDAWVVYIDDSNSADSKTHYLSALLFPICRWHDHLRAFQALRRNLRDNYGIYVRKEIHAREFTAGRGKVGVRDVPKALRRAIFADFLRFIAGLDDVMLFNAKAPKDRADAAFEWLLNRLERTMKEYHAFATIYCDQGKESRYTPLKRRMGVHNPIPSRFPTWMGTGDPTKNIPLDHLVEDPVFVDSARSIFVQLADCCAYALMCYDRPIPRHIEQGLNEVFLLLEPAMFKGATAYNKYGIITVQ